MDIRNKEFRIEDDLFAENSFNIMHQSRPWNHWVINKDQLDALIDILNQLKEEIDVDRKTRNI